MRIFGDHEKDNSPTRITEYLQGLPDSFSSGHVYHGPRLGPEEEPAQLMHKLGQGSQLLSVSLYLKAFIFFISTLSFFVSLVWNILFAGYCGVC